MPRTKAAGEQAVQETLTDAVIFRPSIVFGPEDEFFNRFAEMARYSPVLPLIGGGHTRSSRSMSAMSPRRSPVRSTATSRAARSTSSAGRRC